MNGVVSLRNTRKKRSQCRSTDDGWIDASESGSIRMRPAASSSRIVTSDRITGREPNPGPVGLRRYQPQRAPATARAAPGGAASNGMAPAATITAASPSATRSPAEPMPRPMPSTQRTSDVDSATPSVSPSSRSIVSRPDASPASAACVSTSAYVVDPL